MRSEPSTHHPLAIDEESIDIPTKSSDSTDDAKKSVSKGSNEKLMGDEVATIDGAVDKGIDLDDDDDEKCCIPFRFVVIFVGLMCLVALQANITVINLAFVCMSEDPSGLYDGFNGTTTNRFVYTPKEKQLIFSSVAVGTFIGAIVFNWLHSKFGARFPFFAAGLISAASTVMIPVMAEQSIEMLVLVRFVQAVSRRELDIIEKDKTAEHLHRDGFVPYKMGVFMLTLTASIMAANAGGFFKCGALVSRQYAHFVLATMQMMKCAAHIIGPSMVSNLTDSDGDAKGWRNVFILNCVLMLIANFLFYPFATDKPAEFTKITKETRRLENEERKRQKDEKRAEKVEMA